MNQLQEAALRYADDGWQVFPLHGIENGKCTCGVKCSSPGKHPRVNWSEVATDNQEVIRKWWDKWPNSNVGIATGKRSGIYVIDVDNKESVSLGPGTLIGAGDHSLRKKEQEIGNLPDTRSSTTGSGGTHLIFTYPMLEDSDSLGNRGGLLYSVDTRGDGGYIVAPPSMHQSGNRYRWNDQDLPIKSLTTAWLTFLNSEKSGGLQSLTVASDFTIRAGEGRHEWMFRMGAKLRGQHGLEMTPLYGALMAYNNQHCIPPISPEDVEHIAKNCMKYEPGLAVMSLDTSDMPPLPEGADLAELLFDFLQEEPTPFIPLVSRLLHSGEAMILGGPPNVGKTWAMMDMMLGIAEGGYFANHFSCHKAPVLFIDEEGSRRGDWERFQMLLAGRNESSASGIPLYAKIDSGIRLDSESGHTALARLIERYKPGSVFLDSLVRVHGGNESDNRQMANFFAVVKRLMVTYQTSFVFTHHIRKPAKDSQEDPMWMLRGASDIQGFPDSIAIFLPGKDSSEVKVVHTKMRNAEKLPTFNLNLRIEDDIGRASIIYFEEEDQDVANVTRQTISAMLRNGGLPVTTEQIAAATGLSLKTVIDHMKVLAVTGEVESKKEGGTWWHQTNMSVG